MNKKRVSIIAMIIGLITLVGGVVFLIIRLTAGPGVADGDFLVSVGKWSEDGAASVVWNFTEVGKGTLTTNNHTNDYNFIWAVEDGNLKIETEWLYALENEYDYTLDQGAKILTLKNGSEEIKFVPLDD